MITTATRVVDNRRAELPQYSIIEQVMRQFDYQEYGLVDVLMAAEKAYGCVSRELMMYVSDRMNVPLCRVYGAATLHDLFALGAT